MRPQCRMVLTDSSYRLADRPGDAGASALGCGCGSPIATTEADGTCQLTDEEVAFDVGLPRHAHRPPWPAPRRCRLRSRRGVGGTPLWLGHRGAGRRRRAPGTTSPGSAGPSHGCRLAAFGGDEVQHVELAPGVGEEPGEVSHPFEVPHPHRVLVERDGPVVALATEDVEAWSTVLIALGSDVDARCSVGVVDVPDPLEDDAGCPQLRVRPAEHRLGRGGRRPAPFGRPPPRRVRRLRARDAPPLRSAVLHPRWRLRRAAPARRRGRCWQPTPCSRTGRPPAPAPRRPLGPAPGHRPRPRSRPAPRAAAPDEDRCSEAAPSTAPASDFRAHRVWRRPPTPRPLGPDAPGPGRVVGPIRRGELRAGPPPRLGCRPFAVGSVQVRSTASRAPGEGRGVAPRRPGGLPSPPRRRTRAAGGSRRGGRGSGRGGCRWRWFGATVPWPRSIPRPGRTGRVPAGRRRARSRRPRSRADPARRKPWPPRLRRGAPAPGWTSPSRMRLRASATRPMAAAAGSQRAPMSIARRAHSRAPRTSPVSIRS